MLYYIYNTYTSLISYTILLYYIYLFYFIYYILSVYHGTERARECRELLTRYGRRVESNKVERFIKKDFLVTLGKTRLKF